MAIIGKEIPEWLVDQINYRQILYGRKERTIEDLNYLNNRSPWVKIASAVVIDEERLDLLNQYDGPPLGPENLGRGLAKNFVLFNGVSQLSKRDNTINNLGANGDASYTYEEDFLKPLNTNIGQGWNTVYGFGGTEFGIDAMPGIESLDVKYLNRGALKELNFKIKCFNRNQFNIIDNLYLRLGFSILIEWGNSIFIDENGNYQPIGRTVTETSWFKEKSDTPITEKDILGRIDRTIKQYRGSYEGEIARITNFEWNFNDDGSYDVSIKAISKGDIIESLKANLTPPSKIYEVFKKLQFQNDTADVEVEEEESTTTNFGKNIFTALKHALLLLGDGEEFSADGLPIYKNKWIEKFESPVYNLIPPSDSTQANADLFSFVALKDDQTDIFQAFYEVADDYYDVSTDDVTHLTKGGSIEKGRIGGLDEYSNASELLTNLTELSKKGPLPRRLFIRASKGCADELNQKGLLREYRIFSNDGNVDEGEEIEGINLVSVQPLGLNLSDLSSYIKLEEEDAFILPSQPNDVPFISFNYLMRYLQEHVIPYITYGNKKEESNPKSPTSFRDIISRVSQVQNNKGISHISLNIEPNIQTYALPNLTPHDPRVCLFKTTWKHPATGETIEFFPDLSQEYHKRYTINKGSSSNPFKGLENAIFQHIGNLANLYLNIDFVIGCLKENEDGDSFLYDFLKNICDGINKSLGGINNIEPTIDVKTNTLTFIENTSIPGIYQPPKKTYKLEVFGLDKSSKDAHSTFVQKAGIKTNISKEYASMITIGATSKGYVKGMEASAFSKWNRGCIDYYHVESTSPDESNQPPSIPETIRNEYLPKDNSAYEFNKTFFGGSNGEIYSLGKYSTINFTENNLDEKIGIITEFYKYLHAYNAQLSTSNELTPSTVGFLPFNLKLTLDGFSGFKIYNLLKVNTKFLPSNYPKSLDFIVTKVNHKIDQGGWNTEIETIATPKMSFDKNEIVKPIIRKIYEEAIFEGSEDIRNQYTSTNFVEEAFRLAETFLTNTGPTKVLDFDASKYEAGDTPLLRKAVLDQAQYVFNRWGEIGGWCAAYSYNIAYKVKEHIDKKSTSAIAYQGTSSRKMQFAGAPTAAEDGHRTAIKNLGLYDEVYLGFMTGPQAASEINKRKWNYGDMLNYYAPNRSDKTSGMHTQIYTKELSISSGGTGWTTSTANNYRATWVYKFTPPDDKFHVYAYKVKKDYLV